MSDQLDEAFERLERMTINVSSPDRSVTATYSAVAGVALEFNPKALRNHDEKSLAEQVQHAISAVNKGYGTGIGKVLAVGLPHAASTMDREHREKRLRYQRAVSEFDDEAVSPRGMAKIRIREGAFAVSYRPGILSRMDIDGEVIAAETVLALNSVVGRLEQTRSQAAKRFLEPGVNDGSKK